MGADSVPPIPGQGPDQPGSGVLAGRHIIITRSVADNAPLAADLEQLGAVVYRLPLVEVLPPLDEGRALTEAAARLRSSMRFRPPRPILGRSWRHWQSWPVQR